VNVGALLERAGVRLSEDELQRLERNLAYYEAQLAELRIPEARYAEPGVTFTPQD